MQTRSRSASKGFTPVRGSVHEVYHNVNTEHATAEKANEGALLRLDHMLGGSKADGQITKATMEDKAGQIERGPERLRGAIPSGLF